MPLARGTTSCCSGGRRATTQSWPESCLSQRCLASRRAAGHPRWANACACCRRWKIGRLALVMAKPPTASATRQMGPRAANDANLLVAVVPRLFRARLRSVMGCSCCCRVVAAQLRATCSGEVFTRAARTSSASCAERWLLLWRSIWGRRRCWGLDVKGTRCGERDATRTPVRCVQSAREAQWAAGEGTTGVAERGRDGAAVALEPSGR